MLFITLLYYISCSAWTLIVATLGFPLSIKRSNLRMLFYELVCHKFKTYILEKQVISGIIFLITRL